MRMIPMKYLLTWIFWLDLVVMDLLRMVASREWLIPLLLSPQETIAGVDEIFNLHDSIDFEMDFECRFPVAKVFYKYEPVDSRISRIFPKIGKQKTTRESPKQSCRERTISLCIFYFQNAVQIEVRDRWLTGWENLQHACGKKLIFPASQVQINTPTRTTHTPLSCQNIMQCFHSLASQSATSRRHSLLLSVKGAATPIGDPRA